MKKILQLAILFIINFNFAQNTEIKGIVIDSTGVLPGVTIENKNNKLKVFSDFDGTFKIKAKINDTLLFRNIEKIDQKVKIINFENLNIFLKGGKKLYTVLNYQPSIKRQKIGDVSTISIKEFKGILYTNYGYHSVARNEDLEFEKKYKVIILDLIDVIKPNLKEYKKANYKIFDKLNKDFETEDWINEIYREVFGLKEWMEENDIEFDN